MAAIIGAAVALVISLALVNPVKTMLQGRLTVRNYRGEPVPTAMGLALLLAFLPGLAALLLVGELSQQEFYLLSLWLTLVCLAGLVDDVAGTKAERGFRGHFAALAQGRLTSGMLKVLITAGAAALVAGVPLGAMSWVKAIILMLTVNFFNQMDLRPGRALKVFLLATVLFALAGGTQAAVGAGAALALLVGDLRGRHMLGDTGANLLGAMLGVSIIDLSPSGLMVAMVLMVMANFVGDSFSYTKIIAEIPLLRWLDQLGRQAGD